MKIALTDFAERIEGKILTSKEDTDTLFIEGGYASDLLSDVMGNAKENDCWITIMRHMNVVAVASLAGLAAVLFANDVNPEEAVIEKADENEICLITSPMSAFKCSGILYEMLKDSE